jgi:hypothetical protein
MEVRILKDLLSAMAAFWTNPQEYQRPLLPNECKDAIINIGFMFTFFV